MASFDVKIFTTMMLSGLYESLAFFNQCNRSYDGLVVDRWAKSIDVPRIPGLTASKVADTGRVGGANIDVVNLAFATYTVPITEEVENKFALNNDLVAKFSNDGVLALEDQLDADVYAAAIASLPAAQILKKEGATLAWKDLIKLQQSLTKKKVPRRNRAVIVDVNIEDEFNEIDVVKLAQAHNPALLEAGVTIIHGVTYIVSALLPKIDGNSYGLLTMYKPGMAVVIKNFMVREQVYSKTTRVNDIDYNSYAAIGRLRDEYVFGMV